MKKSIQYIILSFLTLLLLVSPMTMTVKAAELKPMSILLLGTDTGALGRDEVGRSDVLMVMTINPKTGRATITSIPRDTYVEIVGRGFMDKINHAYAFGGAEMSMATVNKFFEMNLNHYIVVNMAGIKQIVDAVGGIDVTPPTSFEISGYTFIAGEKTHINGEQALAYARERYTSGGDYARQERQREIIQAVIAKAGKAGSIFNLKEILSAMNQNVKTDLNMVSILKLFTDYHDKIKTVESYQLTGTGTMIDGVYYDIADEGVLRETIKRIADELTE
ncbi:LCP family protein [Tuanshanicoccus lijuaniae]|uniref:LCP family protein n=1 Tax=Aerococcaceae bacterium zg-1292 TaxID=2774330 RepID=UPI001BD8FAEF|nr:LCP family protein [Aerococcaceae bacterium zg-A91]MBS4458439.1 LCP family protein [Aerococcaceae bacterium zg-BR33]